MCLTQAHLIPAAANRESVDDACPFSFHPKPIPRHEQHSCCGLLGACAWVMLGAWVLPDLNGLAPATGLSLVRRKVRSEVRKRCTDGGKGAAPASPHHITVSSTGDRDLVHCAYLTCWGHSFFFFPR